MNLIEQEEIKSMDIFTTDDLVFVKFAAPVSVFAMSAEQAIAFAKSIMDAAHYITLMGATDGKVH